MRKLFLILLAALLVTFVVIQFFQPLKNNRKISSDHILQKENVPANINAILKNACLDCHSNQTKYLWYHKIAPVSWMINKHIVEGKDELNLSDWGKMDIYDKIGTLEEICQEVERKKMPLETYVKMHKKAKLSDEQKAELCIWTEKLSLELIVAVNN